MSTLEIYFSLDQAWAEIDRMQGWRSWRRWLRPKLYAKRCRQFDTFWFELERRIKEYDATRGPISSRGIVFYETGE